MLIPAEHIPCNGSICKHQLSVAVLIFYTSGACGHIFDMLKCYLVKKCQHFNSGSHINTGLVESVNFNSKGLKVEICTMEV